MKVNRRGFILSTVSAIVATTACSGGSSNPIAPSPKTPTPPPTAGSNLHPQTVTFSEKQNGQTVTSHANRIGGVRSAGVYGTLSEVIKRANISSDTNALGLVTMFDSVRPPSGRGIIFLIKGERFENSVANIRISGGDEWAAYEWKGYV
ncbi:MAG: hypothetical protein KW793_01875 [Candidatus Doudnabacteria bacterium]|nr:hypothetical protein [Candidatus Doudnabacteria bacterium]